MDIKAVSLLWFISFLIKTSSGSGVNNKIKQYQQLANELHQPIIKKFKRRKVYSLFKDNIWGVNLADMQLICKLNKVIRLLLCVIKSFSKYAWVIPLMLKKV